jgi:hypothetical protein
MVAASIESGNGWGIEAGAGIFLRGPLHKSGPEALFIAVPLLGPLILFVLRPNRTGQSASLAIAGGGIIAALIFATQAPLRAFFIVAALIAAIEQGPRWAAPALIFSAALGAIALFGPISRQAPVPLAGAWQLVRAASATPLAWGAPSLPSGAPLPAIARENGRYILIQPTGHPLIHY